MTAKNMLYLEDCRLGQTFTAGPVQMTESAIIAFAKEFDPQFFHTDPVAAKESLFGELVASGWHTAAVTMKLVIEAFPPVKGGLVGRGAEKMNWPRPVKPGDLLSYEGEIIDIRPSPSNPARGTVKIKNRTFNQRGETVLEMETLVVMPRRNAG